MSDPRETQYDRLPEGRRAGELSFRELLRFGWRQITSMRTALVLLLLLALAAVPGSIVPQEGVDALATSRWREDHPKLAPVYDWLGLFDVYGSVWFSAIYLLLMISLVGCIVPRTLVYWRAMRAQPPRAPRNLARLPDATSYRTDESAEQVLARAREVLGRRHRVRAAEDGDGADRGAVSAERGYLREAGNLVFHLSVVVVLVGFAAGSLFGYKGGVIVVEGEPFGNTPQYYDDFVPGRLFSPDQLDPFSFTVDDFDLTWLTEGRAAGQARGFSADVRYRVEPGAEEEEYDLRVNHPLTIGNTDLFLIGHGYAPVITIRDGNGDLVYDGPTVFLPEDQTLRSFGVVKAASAEPQEIGLQGLLFPTFAMTEQGDPVNLFGQAVNPLLSLSVYAGDLGMDDGGAQSVYELDLRGLDQVEGEDGKPLRLDLRPGDTVELPDGLGTVAFEGLEEWQRIQISQTPGKFVALAGVVLALVGLLGSLFIRPRRVWVRAREDADGTLVEVAALDRSGGGDVAPVLADLVAQLRGEGPPETKRDETS
ncbi:cytochrome c biogenesis protein ResB [Nocardioides sp. SOB77]|uniref:Cytochrome c biogenesis protein ResB n=1 Tax=Nocardioides oceani TaxID=3058369 RepID=A0ABT8FBE2_9ACTN|nr:cytochrome c biogenesis protein ResB [Nocardioides oceani]MDN4171755.1 cytochrome c biogenesis protein ResB [Nocardioides oceani]